MIPVSAVDAEVGGTRASVRQRLWNWDSLRWLATFDIVALHTTGAHGAFGWGLPLYLVMTCALAACAGRSVAGELDKRARRLMPPWLWGSALYAATRIFTAILDAKPPLGWIEPAQLLYGTRIHLWFLPFALLAGVGVAAAAPALRRMRPGPAAALLAALVLPLSWLAARAPATWPFSQWAFSLPALPLGLALGLRLSRGARAPLLASLAGLLGVAAFDPLSAALVPRFLGAAVLLGLAVELPQGRLRFVERCTPALLAVYVLHPWVFRQLVHDALWQVGLGRMAWARAGFTFVLSLLLSLGLAKLWALRRSQPSRRTHAPAAG